MAAEHQPNIVQIAQLALRAGMSLEDAQREFRWAVIESALAMTKGNRMQAARILSVHRNTILRDLQQMAEKGRRMPKRLPGRAPATNFYRRGA